MKDINKRESTEKYRDTLPYDKFLGLGPSACTDAELLAIILRTGTKDESAVDIALKVLECPASPCRGLLGLNHLTVRELKAIRGLGEVKAVKLKCIAELSRRMSTISREEGVCFTRPDSVAGYFMESMRHLENEETVLISLDSKAHMLDYTVVSKGTVNMSLISPREIYLHALEVGAVHVILLHNHPSGDPKPSRVDIDITKIVRKAGEILNIPLADHIIIGDLTYYSFREHGLLYEEIRDDS